MHKTLLHTHFDPASLTPAQWDAQVRARLIAHRGNLNGAVSVAENQVEYLLNALRQGYSVELDVRWSPRTQAVYMAHDTQSYPIAQISWTKFLQELAPLIDEWMLNGPWQVPRIWVDWKESHLSPLTVLDSIFEYIPKPQVFNFFIFIDAEMVWGCEKSRRMGNILGSHIPLGWRISQLAGEDKDHIEQAMRYRRDDNDWIWVDDMDLKGTRWLSNPPFQYHPAHHASGKIGYFDGHLNWAGTCDINYQQKKLPRATLVAPDLHQAGKDESISAVLAACEQKWVEAVCTDFAADVVLVTKFSDYLKGRGLREEFNPIDKCHC